MAENRRRCPSWCAGKHDLTDSHYSEAPFLIVRGAAVRARTRQDPGKRKTVTVDGVPVTGPLDADALARLLARLADATPDQHRELAAQVRTAAAIAFGAEAMQGLNDWEPQP